MENFDLERLIRGSAVSQHLASIELEKRNSLTEYLIHVFRSGCPQQIKDEAIFSMFSQDFKNRASYYAIERSVFDVLRRDGDVFKLIENLVETINSKQETIEMLVNKMS